MFISKTHNFGNVHPDSQPRPSLKSFLKNSKAGARASRGLDTALPPLPGPQLFLHMLVQHTCCALAPLPSPPTGSEDPVHSKCDCFNLPSDRRQVTEPLSAPALTFTGQLRFKDIIPVKHIDGELGVKGQGRLAQMGGIIRAIQEAFKRCWPSSQ